MSPSYTCVGLARLVSADNTCPLSVHHSIVDGLSARMSTADVRVMRIWSDR